MRIGGSPAVVKRKDFCPARVTVCIVVCIPHELDYYVHRFDVLKLSLRSLAAHTPRELDLRGAYRRDDRARLRATEGL